MPPWSKQLSPLPPMHRLHLRSRGLTRSAWPPPRATSATPSPPSSECAPPPLRARPCRPPSRGAQVLRRPRPPRPRRLPPRAGHPLRRIRRPLHRQRPPQLLLQATRFGSPPLRCDHRGWHGITDRIGKRAESVRRNA
ncbi:hypothetical protein PVAP13_4KG156230 [Panicum virgatum]|uniref:Uncharacterized protein n=1 Tax=Panicum virgatum TaxID=38727 RepID=A0A8T0TLQ5_PANVG|nr:hypothetical protein PVAP13_4KG156230 [Panicum virgatum]